MTHDTNMGIDASRIDWATEADVVVVGYGGAGAAAAIEAAWSGSTVMVLEKAPEGHEGGNTSVSGGSWIVVDPSHEGELFSFIKEQCPLTVRDEEIHGFCNELLSTSKWVQSLGASLAAPRKTLGSQYPNLNGSESILGIQNIGQPGAALFATLKAVVGGLEGIQVAYEAECHRLIFNPRTREVYGVVARMRGEDACIKARKAVILALGGYENAPDIIAQFCLPRVDIFALGTPYNTGDGLPLVMEVGARVRHFASSEWGPFCARQASADAGVAIAMAYQRPQFDHAILVNRRARRFMDEVRTVPNSFPAPTHAKAPLPLVAYDDTNMEYANLPFFMVFDETRRASGALMNMASRDSSQSWAGVHKEVFTWSDNNLEEVGRGYVLSADTIEGLALEANLDPTSLRATVDEWNAACDAGVDVAFGRTTQLMKIETAPYYLVELALTFINTQGGPDRDGSHRVLDWDGRPIPRLYAGGEFGSIYGFLYQGAGNIPEALGARMAGRFASRMEPW